MRNILSLFFVMALCVIGVSAQGLVQGQPHPSARYIPTKPESQLRADASFSFDDIQFWVGSGSKKAALVIEWHDNNSPDAMVWGYRWDGEASGHDMIVAIAKADPRLVLLTQYTGLMGYTICGIGYSNQSLDITYDLAGAIANPEKSLFRFEEPFPELSTQTKVPITPAEDVASAIRQGLQTGVIYHPLDQSTYGYPSYDYDFWKCNAGSGHWRSGWYYGYWSYWVGNNAGSLSYSGLGATSRQLTDGCWDAWSFQGDMGGSMGGEPLSDHFVAATIPSGGGSEEPEIPVIHVTAINLDKTSLRLQVGIDATLIASVSPVNADNKQVRWTSSDIGVATVKEGVVTGVKPGSVKITAQSIDGGYIAVCEVVVTEAVVPKIDFWGTDAILSFPKVEEATSYEVRVYKYENNSYKRIATYVADAEGNIITELGTKNFRSTLDQISVPLKNLDIDGVYTVEIQVMNGLDIIDTYRVEKISNPVSNEYLSVNVSRVFYQNGTLFLENLEGYRFYLATMSGKILKSFAPQVPHELYPVSLPSGIYLLTGEKDGDRKIFKVHIIQ